MQKRMQSVVHLEQGIVIVRTCNLVVEYVLTSTCSAATMPAKKLAATEDVQAQNPTSYETKGPFLVALYNVFFRRGMARLAMYSSQTFIL